MSPPGAFYNGDLNGEIHITDKERDTMEHRDFMTEHYSTPRLD